jgi:hypothetical protein
MKKKYKTNQKAEMSVDSFADGTAATICAICLDPIDVTKQAIISLPCKHIMHAVCGAPLIE